MVEAIRLGYYGNKRIREGQLFNIKDESEFSSQWMKKIEAAPTKKVEPKKSDKKVIVNFDETKEDDIVI